MTTASLSEASAYRAVAASAWLPRQRRLRPAALTRSVVLAASSHRWVSFAPPPGPSGAAEIVRCPAQWHLDPRAHPPGHPLVLTLLAATALGEGYWQLHARLAGTTSVRALSGLAGLRAPDAGSWLLTADLTPDAAPRRPVDRVVLSALLVAPPRTQRRTADCAGE